MACGGTDQSQSVGPTWTLEDDRPGSQAPSSLLAACVNLGEVASEPSLSHLENHALSVLWEVSWGRQLGPVTSFPAPLSLSVTCAWAQPTPAQ